MAKLLVASERHGHSQFSSTQPVHDAIKQAAAVCSKIPLKCSVAGPPAWKSHRLHWQHRPEIWHFKMATAFFLILLNQEKSLLMDLWHATSWKINAAKLCFLEFLFMPSQVLHGLCPPRWHTNPIEACWSYLKSYLNSIHRACKGLYQVLSIYIMASSLVFLIGVLSVQRIGSLFLVPSLGFFSSVCLFWLISVC